MVDHLATFNTPNLLFMGERLKNLLILERNDSHDSFFFTSWSAMGRSLEIAARPLEAFGMQLIRPSSQTAGTCPTVKA